MSLNGNIGTEIEDDVEREELAANVIAASPTSEAEGNESWEGDGETHSDGALRFMKKCIKKFSRDGNATTEADSPTARLPQGLPINKKYYSMDHENRGMAIIFNHEKYQFDRISKRKGTIKDGIEVKEVFKKLGFKIKYYLNPSYGDIEYIIQTKVLDADHTKSDCIAFIIMTHGKDGDVLEAHDKSYNLDKMISKKLTADKCPSLAGKPKMFFIQACMGAEKDQGFAMQVSTDVLPVKKNVVFIPNEADFFFAYATVPGYFSYRNETRGSWFLQELCSRLKKEGPYYSSILEIMTDVIGTIAFNYSSYPDNYKQIPSFTSRLTKHLIFGLKEVNENFDNDRPALAETVI